MAIGDDAIAAGMAIVDGATTDANTIDTEINRSRDYIAQGAGATDAATASKVIKRDANGRAKVADPAVASDIATKGYADALGNPALAPNTIVRRNADNRFNVGTPTGADNATPKSYVDAAVDGVIDWAEADLVHVSGDTMTGQLYLPNSVAATDGYTICYINSNGRVSRGASSERFKKYISDVDPASLGDLFQPLKRWQMKQGDGVWHYGNTAEQLAAHPDTEPFVVYENVSDPEARVPLSIDFISMHAAMLAQLHAEVAALRARVEQLEAER
jgi:hypothetical protein